MVALRRSDVLRDAVDDLVDEYEATADLLAHDMARGATPDAETEALGRPEVGWYAVASRSRVLPCRRGTPCA